MLKGSLTRLNPSRSGNAPCHAKATSSDWAPCFLYEFQSMLNTLI